MPDNTFDVVSKVEIPEVSNAVQQTVKEVQQRYDLKDSHSNIELKEKDNKILLASKDEFKLKAVIDILESKLVKRKVPLKGLSYGEIIPAAGTISPYASPFSGTPRFTSLDCRISTTARSLNSSWLASRILLSFSLSSTLECESLRSNR